MNLKTKQVLSAFMILAFITSIATIIPINAQTTAKPTYAFCNSTPNPVGVGQETLIHLGISEPTNGTYWQWKGLTVTVIAPDGTEKTLGPFNTDSTGGTGTVLVPDQVGTYKLQTHFPEQKMVPGMTFFNPVEKTYAASDSIICHLVVQEE